MEILDRYIDRLIKDSSPSAPVWNMESIRQGKKPHWNYIDGCMINSLLRLYKQSGDRAYADFADEFMDYYIDENGIPLMYELDTYNLDNICPGQALFELFEYTKKEKYNKAIELLYHQLKNQPRTRDGNFWHKLIYPNQVWLDGLYMAQVFYTKYALLKKDEHFLYDILYQFENVREYMFIESKGLYRHGYDASCNIFWADKESGVSPGFWLRAMGWYAVALADILELLGEDSRAKWLTPIFLEMIEGISKYADHASGMYWQVVDMAGKEGNYLETSGSAMIAYAMLKGARLGLLGKNYRSLGKKTFYGICNKYLQETQNGLNLGGICLVAGLGPKDNLRRDGSYDYYISEPVVENDAKGVAPLLMCYTEIKLL